MQISAQADFVSVAKQTKKQKEQTKRATRDNYINFV